MVLYYIRVPGHEDGSDGAGNPASPGLITTREESRMRTVMRIGAGTVALLALVATGCSKDVADVRVPAEAQSLAMVEVYSARADWTGYEDPVRTVITDEAAWAEAWGTLHATVSPTPERPSIDFDASVLVLAAMGTRPSTGYSVIIEKVQHHDGVLYVSLLERSPGSSCITGAALTAPAHVVQVPRTGTDVEFDVKRETRSC